ncbi:MAG: hypothetical protein P8K77_00170 [Polaribacter sp.]|nr:hypothetical protein [Polaribacter sp.]
MNNHRVISIVVKYSGAKTGSWKHKPDFELESPSELLNIINNYN